MRSIYLLKMNILTKEFLVREELNIRKKEEERRKNVQPAGKFNPPPAPNAAKI